MRIVGPIGFSSLISLALATVVLAQAPEAIVSEKFLAPLIPEGGLLVRAGGSLVRDEFLGVWNFALTDWVDGAANRSLVLLPAEPLGDMIATHEAAIKSGSTAPRFEVSGHVLLFRGVNYLLPTFAAPIDQRLPLPVAAPLLPPGSRQALAQLVVTTPTALSAPSAPPSAPAPTVTPPPTASPTSALSTEATRASAVAPVDPETFAQELERRLSERIAVVPSSGDPVAAAPAAAGIEQPSRSGAVAGDGDQSLASADAQSVSLALLPPMRIQSRRGTVTRDPLTGVWRFIFASGHSDEGDIALELLPCEFLTELAAKARTGVTGATVLLTGDITVFNGRNYLRPIRAQPLVAGKWIEP